MKTLISLELPEDTAQRPSWLEQQLVGLRLGELVSQLEIMLDVKPGAGPSLGEICGDRLNDVLARGLSMLSADQIQQLIHHPQRLLELQERILIEGGIYWSQIPRTDEHEKLIASHRQAVLTRLTEIENSLPTPPSAGSTTRSLTRPRGVGSSRGLVVAAIVLFISAGWWFFFPSGPRWGWDRPGALAINLSAHDYLNRLADAAEEWKNKRPQTEAELDDRLSEFLHGCRTLLASPHPQLQDEDRTWLYGKCNDWIVNLNRDLDELRSRKRTMNQALEDADKTISNLVAALKKRAIEINGRPTAKPEAV